jgi:hypothetical protein
MIAYLLTLTLVNHVLLPPPRTTSYEVIYQFQAQHLAQLDEIQKEKDETQPTSQPRTIIRNSHGRAVGSIGQ